MNLGVGRGMVAALLAMGATAADPAPLAIACGAAPLTDGRFDKVEWIESIQVPVGNAKLLIKSDADSLYVGVRLPRQSYRYVDLYFEDSGGRLLNLHASMQQGERVLTGEWSDTEPAFTWKPTDWKSSIARRTGASSEAPIAEQLQPLDGYEIAVPLSYLGRPPYRLRAEVRDFVGEARDWTFPNGSTRRDPKTWAQIAQPPCS